MYATRALRMMPTKRMMRLPVRISLDSGPMTLLTLHVEGGPERYVNTPTVGHCAPTNFEIPFAPFRPISA